MIWNLYPFLGFKKGYPRLLKVTVFWGVGFCLWFFVVDGLGVFGSGCFVVETQMNLFKFLMNTSYKVLGQ